VLLVDHGGAAQLVLELRDALFQHRLLVLGVVVLGVLGDVPELPGLLDPIGDFAPLIGLQVLQLALPLPLPERGLSFHLCAKNPCYLAEK
jgi:hypothetical protein